MLRFMNNRRLICIDAHAPLRILYVVARQFDVLTAGCIKLFLSLSDLSPLLVDRIHTPPPTRSVFLSPLLLDIPYPLIGFYIILFRSLFPSLLFLRMNTSVLF